MLRFQVSTFNFSFQLSSFPTFDFRTVLKRLHAKIIGRLGYVVKSRRTAIKRGDGSVIANLLPGDLMTALHGESIYEGFDFQSYPNDPAGWGGTSPAFAELITENRQLITASKAAPLTCSSDQANFST